MPPFVGRKRLGSLSPTNTPKAKKPSLFDTADKPTSSSTVQDNKAFLEKLDGEDSGSSLSDVSSSEFEDVAPQPARKKQKIEHENDDDEVDWEDAIKDINLRTTHDLLSERPLGDLELTLDKGINAGSLAESYGKKKGPTKIERQIRISTHCMHVQFLLFHNLKRNGWTCDKEVQAMLIGQLPPGVKKEIEKWKTACGMKADIQNDKSKASKKGRASSRKGRKAIDDLRSQREWGKPAERQEEGAPNMSSGDPILRLLRVLAAYWKKRFTITAPSLRKQGYKSLSQLEAEIASFKNENHNAEEHGECVDNIEDFRKLAKTCEGSRDIGEQLFVALIRGLSIQARLIASLQPVGFGWGKNEDASVKAKKSRTENVGSAEESDDDASPDLVEIPKPSKPKAHRETSERKVDRRRKEEVSINVADESTSETQEIFEESDDCSVVDVTPLTPKKRKLNKKYDLDMSFPTYWTEVISPITNEVYPVEPFLLKPSVASKPEHMASFEPRGKKADRAKLVLAYVVAYDDHGCAKEVTTRYLKRHMWPGRTKGVRMPVERIPVYNKRGKIKHHEDYDWFKTVMSGYSQLDYLRTVVDDLEEVRELKAVKPEKRETKQGEDTLQGYKTSVEHVLERFLRREEVLRPGAQPVKNFTTGKGDKAKDEPVFLRKDVIICRTGESWHKEGRQVKNGEHPVKMVPVRAVTLARKREVEEAERDGGEKMKQGMYSKDQTEYIIPPPIENSVIPKNAYGNIDCFVPSMVPKGAVHIPLRRTMPICKRLGISYAEAVTGFEFGNKRAVPVVEGVVVAVESKNIVINEWEKDEEERRRKEDAKREKAALATWRKFLMGLKIIKRMREEYSGDIISAQLKEEINPFTNPKGAKKSRAQCQDDEADGKPSNSVDEEMASGSLVNDASEADATEGGFIRNDHEGLKECGSSQGDIPPTNTNGAESPIHSIGELVIEHGDATPRKAFRTFQQSSKHSERAKLMEGEVEEPERSPSVRKRGRPKKTAAQTPNVKSMNTKATLKVTNDSTPNGAHNFSPSENEKSSQTRDHQVKVPKVRAPSKRMPSSSLDGQDEPAAKIDSKRKPIREAPMRKAATQSASAVANHYFNNSSEEGDGSDEEEDDSKDPDVVEFAPTVKTKKAGKSASTAQNGRRKSR